MKTAAIRRVLILLLLVTICYIALHDFTPNNNPDAKPFSGTQLKADFKASNGWPLFWADEFDGNTLDNKFWTLQVGENCWGNNELQYYTDNPENCYVRNGKLVIRGLRENYGSRRYTSARITTKGKLDFLYGRIEIKAKLPKGKGLFPAFWLLPSDDNYRNRRKNGEIDIMEMLGDNTSAIYAVAHYSMKNKYKSSSKYHDGNTDFSMDFHTYALEWSPRELKWFVDDKFYYSFNLERNFSDDYQPFNKRFYLILNLAIGGNWPGEPSKDTVFPAQMEIEYVRYYNKKQPPFEESYFSLINIFFIGTNRCITP